MSSTTGSDNKAGIQKTGSLLLAGWKMLSDVCPICSFPLMSKLGVTQCPNCCATVITESEYQLKMPKVSEAVSKPEENVTSQEGVLQTVLAHPIDDYASYRKKQDDVSSKLGKKMMLGWTLLGTVCPKDSCRGTPLMSLKGQPTMECVSCECLFKASEYGDLVALDQSTDKNTLKALIPSSATMTLTAPAHNVKSQLQSDSNPPSSFSTANSLSLLEESSKVISQKLVLGWSLLSEVCMKSCNGQVPLMKDLNGNVLCVYCSSGETSKRQKMSDPVENRSEVEPTSDDDDEDYNDESFQAIIDDMKKKRLAEILKPKAVQNNASIVCATLSSNISNHRENVEPVSLVSSIPNKEKPLISIHSKSKDGNSERLTICSGIILKKIEQSCAMLENSSCSTQDCIAFSELITQLSIAYRSVLESSKL